MRSLTLRSASSAPHSCREAEPAAGLAVPKSRYVLFLLVASLGCAADLLTKHWIFQWRGMPGQHDVWWIWEGYVGIETATNSGALFGMGRGFTWLFALLSVLAAGGILYWLFVAGAARDRLLTVALGSIMGGILGNLYDRLGLWEGPGMNSERLCHVRDWILLRYQHYSWPNFNIADCLLVCGAGLLMWHAYWYKEPGSMSSVEDATQK